MAKILATPETYKVFNAFDQHGILLDLIRLKNEDNVAYKQRLLDVFVHRASSTYMGLLHGVTRELGLSIEKGIEITALTDSNDDTLVPHPAVEFEDTKCRIYSDFSNDVIYTTLDRFDPTGGAFTFGELIDQINATSFLTASLSENAVEKTRSMTIYNQSTINIVPNEELDGKGSIITLDNNNLIPGTVSISSQNLTKRVDSEIKLRTPGDYYIRHKEGVIVALGAPAPGSVIRYSNDEYNFTAEYSPVILHNIQSDDFKTKMFQQVCDDIGEACNGLPNNLGADIINELMSVFPSLWGN